MFSVVLPTLNLTFYVFIGPTYFIYLEDIISTFLISITY